MEPNNTLVLIMLFFEVNFFMYDLGPLRKARPTRSDTTANEKNSVNLYGKRINVKILEKAKSRNTAPSPKAMKA